MNLFIFYIYLFFSILYFSEHGPSYAADVEEAASSGRVRIAEGSTEPLVDEQVPIKKKDTIVGQKTYGQIDLPHATLGEWISLEMMSRAETQGMIMYGDSGLGGAMQQHDVTRCEKLPPYAPWGPIRVEGLKAFLEKSSSPELIKKIPHALKSLLLQIDPAHAFQIFMYPTVWKIGYTLESFSNIEMVPLVLSRPNRPMDVLVDIKSFLEAYNIPFLEKIAHYLKQLCLKKDIIPLLPGIPPRVAGYLGQFLGIQPDAATYLTHRDGVIQFLLEKDKNTVYSQFLLARGYKSLGMMTKAEIIFRKLWYEGSALAAFNYAILDQTAIRIKTQDQLNALQFAANMGLPVAQFHWAMISLKSLPFPNYESIRVFLERSADQGVPQAMMRLGYDLLKGRGGPKDLSRAATLFEAAGSEGVKKAYLEAGKLAHREGTESGYAKARQLYTLALEQDPENRQIRNLLAVLWAQGLGGSIDLDKALSYVVVLANDPINPQGQACYNVGEILLLKQNQESDKEARSYFKRGADLNDAPCAYQYAVLCRDGVGGEVNLSEVQKYAEMAQNLGYDKARALIQTIKQEALAPK